MRPEIKRLVEELLPDADDAVVIDFETFYNDECSVKTLGNWAYSHHRDFDAYLVTVFGRGVDYVGHPAEFDWDSIHDRVWVAHNAPFDRAVFDRLQEQGAIPKHVHAFCGAWKDTADLAAFLGYPRNLAGAAKYMFGISLDKAVRDSTMKNKYWWQFSDEEKGSVTDYASDDAIAWCIWQRYRSQWPADEQAYSEHTGMSGSRGAQIDVDRLTRDIDVLSKMKWRLEQDIPWLGEEDEKGKPYKLGSPRALKDECDRAGVPVPESTSIKNAGFLEWLDLYGDQVPAVIALCRWRKVNRSHNLYQTLRDRLRPDGTVETSLKYYGAQATGRWAGGSGLNFQNLMKEPMYCDSEYRFLTDKKGHAHAVDIRACVIARPGKKMMIADLSQIEPRVLNWFTGNEEFNKLLASGMGPYEAHARASMGWTGGPLKKESPGIYALAKARVLALGYGAGWRKFIEMARGYVSSDDFKIIFEAEVSESDEARFLDTLKWLVDNLQHRDSKRDLRIWNSEELTRVEKNIWVNSWLQVTDFRKNNPLLADKHTGLWKSMDRAFRAAAADGDYVVSLPSGRDLFYFDVSSSWGWSARRVKGGKPERVYGGLIVENITQAMARDVFAPGILRLEAAGIHVLFTVHDEVVCECDPGVTEADILKCLCVTPEWAQGLVVEAEVDEAPHYRK